MRNIIDKYIDQVNETINETSALGIAISVITDRAERNTKIARSAVQEIIEIHESNGDDVKAEAYRKYLDEFISLNYDRDQQ